MIVLYIVDTSEWINLFRLYPKTIFFGLWENIEDLISNKRIISPKIVLDEIKKGYDDLEEWCKKHPKMFYNPPRIREQAMNIVNKHPTLIKRNIPYEIADPYVIALAVFYKRSVEDYTPIIVTGENVDKESRIPYVARDYDIRACKLLEMFKMEGWKF